MSKRRNKFVEVRWFEKDGGWFVYDLDGRSYCAEELKRDAIRTGRELAKRLKCELVVKNKNGKISFRNSYGGDSRRRPG